METVGRELNLTELRRSLAGAVIAPGDPGYESARRCFNLLIDRRPDLIVRCHGADDVTTALAFARDHALPVAVRGGGHNPAGHCVCDGGLVIDLSLMRRVEVDAEARLAHVQGGARWLEFDSVTQESGFVTPGGVVGSTGVAGLTFGGGIGHLIAQHGFTCDNLLAAELVIPDGRAVRASADENSDLLWGLRGGGGNFGVATQLEFRLHPLRQVLGGRLTYSGRGVAEAVRLFRDLAAGGPRDLSCEVLLWVDEELVPVLAVAPCYTGSSDDPAELHRLRSAPGLVTDGLRVHSFLAQQHVFNPGYGVDRNYWKGHFVSELPDELIDELIERLIAFGRPPGQILIESLHGTTKDIDPGTAAIGFRGAAFNVSVMASWLDPALDEAQIAWTRETAAAIEPWSVSGGYVNYMQADEPTERVRGAFGDRSFERLQALKRRYDPNNVLSRNQNIPPSRLTVPPT